MEYTKDKLKADLVLLERALATLEETLRVDPSSLAPKLSPEILRDATIQRFEYVFELSWKALQVAARHFGNECNSPREAVKQGFKIGWIKDSQAWFEALEARNQTSHLYHEDIAREVYEISKKFPSLVKEIITALNKL